MQRARLPSGMTTHIMLLSCHALPKPRRTACTYWVALSLSEARSCSREAINLSPTPLLARGVLLLLLLAMTRAVRRTAVDLQTAVVCVLRKRLCEGVRRAKSPPKARKLPSNSLSPARASAVCNICRCGCIMLVLRALTCCCCFYCWCCCCSVCCCRRCCLQGRERSGALALTSGRLCVFVGC